MRKRMQRVRTRVGRIYISWPRVIAAILTFTMLIGMTGCKGRSEDTTKNTEEVSSQQGTIEAQDTQSANVDRYADQDFSVPDGFDQERDGVSYGTFTENVTYYSTVIQQEKECVVLLPPDYEEQETYPVIYTLHGFGGGTEEWRFVQTTYGNMVADGIATKAIIVLCDMWTDEREFSECTGEEQRASYDRFVYDLEACLMPYIESNYSVKTGRENTAIIGLSQGGTESLAIGFLLQDKIGYIASLAPCPGVIPTTYYEGTFWNTPIMDDFHIESEETMPEYILLTVGSIDPWDIECTQYYDQIMTEEGIPHDYYMLEGGDHLYPTWIHSFYNFVRRIF